jgi:cytochrome c556
MHPLVRTLVVSVAVVTSGAAFAEPSDVVKYRKAAMKANGGHMAAAGAIIQGKVEYKDQLVEHARALEGLNKNIAALFPKGTDKETDTREEVWKNWAEFEKRAKDARDKSAAFAKAAAGKDMQATAARYRELGGTCKACHQDFRSD